MRIQFAIRYPGVLPEEEVCNRLENCCLCRDLWPCVSACGKDGGRRQDKVCV